VRIAIREELAEFIGTFVFMLLGFGASAQATVGAGNAIEAYISWGFGLSIGLWYAAGISGGHLNPSVTIASAVYTKFPWKKVPRYIFAQLLGGVTSALVIYAVYFPLIQAYASGSLATPTPGGSADTTIVHPTAGIFSSFPSPGVSTGSAVVATLVASGVFVGSILAFINGDNQGSPKTHVPIAIGILLMLVGMSLGAPAGGAVNPAADLGGRIAMAMVGYGGKVFSAYDAYFWIPIVIGPVGAVI
ncbi:aquaporin-like protein, partial [Blastocladiella britannica]